MTSAEFAGTYRALKTLTEHGARTVVAQEVALGRMVMAHYLEVGSSMDRQRLRDGVAALEPTAAAKVFGVFEVDGTTVIVTHFIATFTDLPTWLRENAGTSQASSASTVVVPTVSAPAPAPAPGTPSTTKPTATRKSVV